MLGHVGPNPWGGTSSEGPFITNEELGEFGPIK